MAANLDQLVRLMTQQQQQFEDKQRLVQQQSQQIAQLLANQNAANIAVGQPNPPNPVVIPSLPDVSLFEACDEKSRVSEWLERFKFALDCAAPTASDQIKVKSLMNKLSEMAFSEYSRSVLPASVTDFDFPTTVQKLEKLFAKPQSIFIDRYECLKAVRGDGEDFRHFINRHKKLLNDFKFDDLKKEQFYSLMLLTALKAPSDATLRQRILAKLATDGQNVTYDGIVEDLINFQSTIAEARAIETPISSRNVNAVQQKGKQNFLPKNKFPKSGQTTTANKSCWRCGECDHPPFNCRFKVTKCPKCGTNGHLGKKCESVQAWRKQQSAKMLGNKKIGHLRIGMTSCSINALSLMQIKILLNQQKVQFFLDTGSDIDVIDELTYAEIGKPPIEVCDEIGKTFDGKEVPFIGKGIGIFKFGEIEVKRPFYVAKAGSLNLLSCQTMDKFGLLDEMKLKISNVAVNLCKAGRPKGEKIIPSGTKQMAGTEAFFYIIIFF